MRVLVTLFISLVMLVAGAVAGYLYSQVQTASLSDQVATLETRLARADQSAQAAASEIRALRSDLDARIRLTDQLQAKIVELEGAMKPTMSEPPQSAQPAEPATPAQADSSSAAPAAPAAAPPPLPRVRP